MQYECKETASRVELVSDSVLNITFNNLDLHDSGKKEMDMHSSKKEPHRKHTDVNPVLVPRHVRLSESHLAAEGLRLASALSARDPEPREGRRPPAELLLSQKQARKQLQNKHRDKQAGRRTSEQSQGKKSGKQC